jgi:hypothetical protein
MSKSTVHLAPEQAAVALGTAEAEQAGAIVPLSTTGEKNDARVAFAPASEDHGVPPEISRQVFASQNELRGAFRDSVRVGVRLGHALSAAKEACRHGEFIPWLKAHFDGSARQAQRFMELGREYPDPEKVPPLSLREALRLIAGGKGAERKPLAHERLSRQTVAVVSRHLAEMLKLVEKKIIAQLEVEGVTGRHDAMKRARQIEGNLRRFRDSLRGQVEPEADAPPTASAPVPPAASAPSVTCPNYGAHEADEDGKADSEKQTETANQSAR